MKRAKNFDSTNPSLFEQPPPELRGDKKRLSAIFQSRKAKSVIVITALALLATVYLLANKDTIILKKESSENLEFYNNAPEVEVLDAVGNMKAAQFITNYIRSKGFDVVELKKNSEGIEDKSFIIDRSGKFDDAKRLALELGILENKVFQILDPKLYLDITVVIGKDFRNLKAFQSTKERNKN